MGWYLRTSRWTLWLLVIWLISQIKRLLELLVSVQILQSFSLSLLDCFLILHVTGVHQLGVDRLALGFEKSLVMGIW